MKMEFKSRTTERQENQESRTGSWKWCQDRYQNQITQQQQQKKERVLIDLPRICKFYNKKWQVQRKRDSGYVCVYTYVLIIVLNKILRQKWWAFNFCDFLSNSFVLFNFNFYTNSLSFSLSLSDSRVVLLFILGPYRRLGYSITFIRNFAVIWLWMSLIHYFTKNFLFV